MRGRAILIAVIVGAIAGCDSVIGAHFNDQKLAVCTPATPPGPPMVAPSSISNELTVVITSLDWGDTTPDGYRSVGYDLDGRCTSLLDSPLCAPPAWTAGVVADGTGGRDNALGGILANQEPVFGISVFTSDVLNMEEANGKFAPPVVFHVTNFNGFADDDQVTVEWYRPALFPSTGGPPLKTDGTETLDVVDGVKFVDDHAYVNKYQLVARFPRGAEFNFINSPYDFLDAIVTATVTPKFNPQRFELSDGVLAGHSTAHELLFRIPAFTHNFLATVCEDAPVWPKVKKWVCGGLDARTSANASGACDAFTFAFAFQTVSAKIGMSVAAPPYAPFCPANTDTANETCDNPPAQ